VIYLDSSVILAHLLVEDRCPAPEFWARGPFATSQLAEYEVWNRLYARRLAGTQAERAQTLFARLILVDLSSTALARALEPLPISVKTLDGLHLATMDYLRSGGEEVVLASYDRKFQSAALALGFSLAPL